MDWINRVHMICEKMKMQMHAKGVDSLDVVYLKIAAFDSDGKAQIFHLDFEKFLSHLGIFLKSQELHEIHKYLKTYETGGFVQFENFIELLKCEVPPTLINEVDDIFNQIKDADETVSVSSLKGRVNYEKHPRVKLMQKEVPLVRTEFERSIDFIVCDKPAMTLGEFEELHRNMYWVTPRENISYFFNNLPELWGLKK